MTDLRNSDKVSHRGDFLYEKAVLHSGIMRFTLCSHSSSVRSGGWSLAASAVLPATGLQLTDSGGWA